MKDVKDWEVRQVSGLQVVELVHFTDEHMPRPSSRRLLRCLAGGEERIPQPKVPSYGQHSGAVIVCHVLSTVLEYSSAFRKQRLPFCV